MSKKLQFVFGMLLASALAGCVAKAPKEVSAALPDFIFDTLPDHSALSGGQFFINCLLNDSIPVMCAYDTGASGLLLDRAFCERNGIDLENTKIRIAGVGAGFDEARFAKHPVSLSYSSAGKTFQKPLVIDLKNRFGRRMDALVGLDFFYSKEPQHSKIVSLDYIDGRLRIYDSLPQVPDTEGYERLPMPMGGNNAYCPVVLCFGGQRLDGYAVIDTGNGSSLHLMTRVAENYGLDTLPCLRTQSRGFGGQSEAFFVVCDSILLGSRIVRREPVSFTRNRRGAMHGMALIGDKESFGLLGGSELALFDVLLDFPDEAILLRPNRRYEGQSLSRYGSGIAMIDRTDICDGWIVWSVRADYPAAEAGLREGDTLTHVNGQRVTAFDGWNDPRLTCRSDSLWGYTLTWRRDTVRTAVIRNKRLEYVKPDRYER